MINRRGNGHGTYGAFGTDRTLPRDECAVLTGSQRDNSRKMAKEERSQNLFVALLFLSSVGALVLVLARPKEFVEAFASTVGKGSGAGSPLAMRMASSKAEIALSELQSLVDKEIRRTRKANRHSLLKEGALLEEAEEPELPPSGCEATVMIVRHCESKLPDERVRKQQVLIFGLLLEGLKALAHVIFGHGVSSVD